MLHSALSQAWPPFVLVTGLLMVGRVAHHDGLFTKAGSALNRLPGPPVALFVTGALLVAIVTALLNLDTAIVFLTPILVLSARQRGMDEEPFVYMAVFMTHAASLYLPGSNLTNLIVLAGHPVSGGQFAADFLPAALAATAVTIAGLLLIFRRRFGQGATPQEAPTEARWLTPGLAAVVVAAVLTVVLHHPALPVLAVGLTASAHALLRHRLTAVQVIEAVNPKVLAGVFTVAVSLGVLARSWDGPAQLIAGAGRIETATIGALGSVLVNNLPAAVLLSAQNVPHPHALLIGLNIGPSIAVTGSLSAYLWIQAAKQVDAKTSILAFSRRGLLLAPPAIAAALAVSSG